MYPSKGKFTRKSNRPLKRKQYKPRVKKSIVQKTHIIKRLGTAIELRMLGGGLGTSGSVNSALSASGSGLLNTYDVAFGLPFCLNNTVDPADLSNLFDRYRILGVKLKFMFDINDANITGAGVLPWISYAQDYDDAQTPANENVVLVKQYCKTRRLDKTFSIYIRPKPQLVAGQISGTTSNSAVPNSKNLYFNCTDLNAVFYGLKGWIRGWYSPTGAQSMLRIQPTYYVALKDTQ